MPPTTHISKRPYAGTHSHHNQSSITSYFPSSNVTKSSTTRSHSHDVLSPPLPPTIQSNLLSVGMRVRKSVPEGYKTGSYSAFSLFSENSPKSVSAQQTRPSGVNSGGARKELMPFCGILKVGGLAQQDTYADAEDEDLPWLSSQGSTISDISVASAPGNKRRFDEEDEEDEDEVHISGVAFADLYSSPTLAAPGHGAKLGGRAMALPKSKLRSAKITDVRLAGQENSMDFEEAEFLDFAWKGTEVDMRDV